MREPRIEFFSTEEAAVCRRYPTGGAPLRTLLRSGTRIEHEALEGLLALDSPELTLPRYLRFLRVLHAWHAAIEPRLASPALRILGVDMRPRSKLAWLRSDLAHFKATPDVPVRLYLPALESGAAQLGCAYVLEGATLGGAVLYPLIANRWDLDPGTGAGYLFGRGRDTGTWWKSFVLALDAAPLGEDERLDCVEAARATFEGIGKSFLAIREA